MNASTQNTPRMTNLYFYIPGRTTPQDIVCIKPESTTPPTSDHYFGLYSKKTLTEYQKESPGIRVLTWEEVAYEVRRAAMKPVTEITFERYTDMLEVLPPLRWVSSGENTTFMLIERFTDNITDIFARIHTGEGKYRYFTLRDVDTLTHREIVEKVMLFINR
ncbi:DUF1419 domain-containing protein [Escherichia coli]|nr:DUF1419 domain-containing protein [Escherichia coli]